MYNVRDPYSPSTSLWSQLIAVFCSSFLTMCSFFRTALSLHKLWCPVAGTWVLHHPSGGPHHEGHHPVNPHHDGPHQQGQHPPVNPLWPTNPLKAGRKLSMLVKASQWVGKFSPDSWMGHLGPYTLGLQVLGRQFYGPRWSGLYQRKLECDTIVIFIQRARHVSRNHAWYTWCHTNKNRDYFFWLLIFKLGCIWLWSFVSAVGGAHHLVWLCNGQNCKLLSNPKKVTSHLQIHILIGAQGCITVIF